MRTTLLLSAASLAIISAPAQAASILYSDSGSQAETQTVSEGGVSQVKLDNGAVVSIVGPADFTLRGEDIIVRRGGVTIAGSAEAPVTIVLPGDTSAVVAGSGSLTVTGALVTGNVMLGQMTIGSQSFAAGQNWTSRPGRNASRVFANGAQWTPGAGARQTVADAAETGLPVTLGEALAGVGAAGDVIAASRNVEAYLANPALVQLPSGDVARLLAFSDRLAAALGGASFDGASPAVVNAYLQYLASGGEIGAFQSAYAQLVSQYLTLLAEGGFASEYQGADLTALNAYLAYLQDTAALGQIGAGQQDLLAAYLAFLNDGGVPSQFIAPASLLNEEALAAYVAAISGYANFLGAGGDPADFGTSAAIVQAYLENIAASGLLEELFGAQAVALNAYLDFLAAGGSPSDFDGFGADGTISEALAAQYVAAIQAYVAFIQGGGVPAEYQGGANIIATYLQALQNAGLFSELLGAQATTLQAYLDFIAEGGAPGDFNGFGISEQLAAQYTSAIQAYIAFIQNGGVPTDFQGGPALIASYLEALQDAGLFSEQLGEDAGVLQAYLDFINGGGAPGDFTGFGISEQLAAQYAEAVQAYIAFIQNGGDPANYTGGASVIEAYLAALQGAGVFDDVFGAQASVLQAYLDFLNEGGNPGDFNGFGISDQLAAQYAQAVQAYIAFIQGGGDPANYAGGAAIIETYLAALQNADLFDDVFGAQAAVLQAYLDFLNDGGNPGDFGGFGISDQLAQQYAAAVQAYLDFIDAGGIPSAFEGLSAELFQAYLEALSNAGLFDTLLAAQADFLGAYLAFLQGGGDIDDFDQLPPQLTDQQKLLAVQDFISFLRADGDPSAYDGETLARLAAFFEESFVNTNFAQNDVAGQLLLREFFSYVQSGRDVDTYAGLPANGGTTPTLASTYAISQRGGAVVSTFGVGANPVVLDSEGKFAIASSFSGIPLNGTVYPLDDDAVYSEFFRDDDFIVGRITNVTTFSGGQMYTLGDNQGAHYALVPELANLPDGATVYYDQVFATSPTFADGSSAPGTFDADIAINFQANGATRLATEGTIVMPGDATYSFTTPGGIAGVEDIDANTFITSTGTPLIQQGSIAVTGTGKACLDGASCTLYMAAMPGGADAELLGVSYVTRNGGEGAIPVHGAAAFTAGDAPGAVEPQAGTLWPGVAVDIGYLGSTLGRESESEPQVFVNEAGQIVGYDIPATANEQVNAGSSTLTDTGSAADGAVRWARFADGTLAGEFFGFDTDVSANGGFHILAGIPTAELPQTGIVLYEFAGGTAPTAASGNLAPGTFTGQAAVAWGSEARLGLDASVAVGSDSYDLTTTGGVTDPTQSQVRILNFVEPRISGYYQIASTGAACPDAMCGVSLNGGVYGEDAAALGFVYNIVGETGGDAVTGSAVFAKGDPVGGGGTGGGDFSTALVGENFDTSLAGTLFSFPRVSNDFVNLFSQPSIGPVVREPSGAISEIRDYRNPSQVRFSNLMSEMLDQRGDDRALLLTYEAGDVSYFDSTISTAGYSLVSSVADAATFLPVSGNVIYDIVHTTPAYSLNPALADGVFDAQIAVSFGSTPRIGLEGTLDLDTLYSFSTEGGVSVPQITRNLTRTDMFLQAALTGDGLLCAASQACQLVLRGVFSDDYERIATAWHSQSNDHTIYGASIFGADNVAGLSVEGGPGASSGSLSAAFDGTTPNIAFADGGGLNRVQTNRQVYVNNSLDLTFDDRGVARAESSFGLLWDRGTLETADLAGTSEWQVGRYNGGRFTQGVETSVGSIWGQDNGFAYAVIQPFSGTMPSSGTINYSLLAATRPTYSNEATAPGTFDAQMALLLGTAPTVAIEGTITMPDGSYAVSTYGGLADPSKASGYFNTSLFNFTGSGSATPTGNGAACVGGNCSFAFAGSIGGVNGSYANLSYYVSGSSLTGNPNLSGAAVFTGTLDGGGSGLPDGDLVTDQIVAYSSTTIGIDTRAPADVIYDNTTGAPVAYEWASNATTRQNESPNIGTATQHDSGSVTDIIGWTRWADGKTAGRYFANTTGFEMPANGGWHVVSGDAATNLPTTGTVQYALVGSTAPTIRDGSMAPGSFSGDLAVAFGSTPRVGVEFDIAIGGNSYAINTPGGVADPMAGGMAVGADMRFFTEFDQPVYAEGTGPVCDGGDCRAFMQGFLSGDGASHVGIVYTFGNTFDQQVDGSAVFGVTP